MAYSEDLRQCRLFYRHGGHRLLIGEWTLAGPTLNEEDGETWRRRKCSQPRTGCGFWYDY